MSKIKHNEILKKGVAAWNHWRDDHPDLIPDLCGANLKEANLRGANLSSANLDFADLRNANLESAKLDEANTKVQYLIKVQCLGGHRSILL